ncbi:MAG: phosphatase PAP2 family protein [bacterium]
MTIAKRANRQPAGMRVPERADIPPQAAPASSSRHVLSRRSVMFEIGLATAAYLSYFLVRGFTQSGFQQAADNANLVIRFEKWTNLYHETVVQGAMKHHDSLLNLANWVYIWGHWPVIIVVGTWLLWSSPREYRTLRNTFLISGGIGLLIFATFPVAPPRLLDVGLIDTITERSHSYRVLQPPAFVNQYAAMPSLHFGWDLIIGIVLVRNARSPYVRALGFLLPVAMGWAVIATGNHFVIDTVAGAALALFGLMVATLGAEKLDKGQERIQFLAARALRLPRPTNA